MFGKQENIQSINWKRVWTWVLLVCVVFGIVFFALISYASSYDGRVFLGVHVGDVHIGGMDESELRSFLGSMQDKLIDAGVTLEMYRDGEVENVHIAPTVVTTDSFFELIRMNVEEETELLLSYQKNKNPVTRAWAAILTRITEPHVQLQTVELDRGRFLSELETTLAPYTEEARDAGVIITRTSPLSYDTVTSSRGIAFEYEHILGSIVSSWKSFVIPVVALESIIAEPTVHDEDLAEILDVLPTIFQHGSIELTYTDSHTKRDSSWRITENNIADWLVVQHGEDNGFAFGLSPSSTSEYMVDTISSRVDREAKEAKFAIGADGKVSEFQGSRPGVALNVDETYALLNEAVLQRNWHKEGLTKSIPIVVDQVEPEVKTGEVNDLGISEILGTGYSNFSGSPSNRIKNIRHAVERKLNGLLIKPDEDFSLLRALEPFTLEGGYLPELVIKGDEIKPEIAGGLCQIGSTMFRTVMNAGLDVTQRRNHSLVVSYYNDHRNGLPGTDATIYDPAPDFKFKNDTGHYILLTTSMNVKNGDLYFTFWGTSDGREGRYTQPVVHRWIPTGPEKIIETTDLEPGERNCQSAHPGAETSFTYVKTLPNGETEERVFSSYYRPLPKICLVGVEEKTMCQELPDGSTSCATEDGEGEGIEDVAGEKIEAEEGIEDVDVESGGEVVEE